VDACFLACTNLPGDASTSIVVCPQMWLLMGGAGSAQSQT
jgi:hypothetical protein